VAATPGAADPATAVPAVAGGPRIAIVFDDLGYSTEGLARELLEMPARLTFAVLPGLRHSLAFAESARARGHEVILHLPMEPIDTDRHDPGENALWVDLEPEENLRRVRLALDGLPFYAGVSNHMGSRYTASSDGMEIVLREIRARSDHLFFLDSRTTPHSVALDGAHRLGVPCLGNDLFLDSTEADALPPEIQTVRLGEIARRRGRAVAIGHVRAETVAAVREAIRRWSDGGIRLVGLSDLMHRGAGGGPRAVAAREPGG
jgi:polysaccharide deacetylase 2 family uncharacterized protein YibQ